MENIKISLGVVLAILAAVGFGFFCFLGFYFDSLGDIEISLIVAIIFLVLLLAFALSAKKLKQASRNFRTCIMLEWTCLALFAFIAVAAIYPFSHFFVVSAQKDEIQKKVVAGIEQAENMFAEYENYANTRVDMYSRILQSVVAGRRVNPTEYRAYGFESGIDDNIQIENKIFTIRNMLFSSNYEIEAQENTQWLAHAKNTMTSWKPIGVIMVVNLSETYSNQWLSELIQHSEYRQLRETAVDFSYDLFFEDITQKFEFSNEMFTAFSIVCAIAAYLLMLLPYFVTKRHTRFPGLKMVLNPNSGRINRSDGDSGRNIVV